MPQATGRQAMTLAGLYLSWDFDVTSDAQSLWQPIVPTAPTVTDWTNLTSSSGTAVVDAGHGIEDGDKVDIYSDDGTYVYGATATVVAGYTTDEIDLAGGTGTYPATTATVKICKQMDVSIAFDGDEMTAMIATTRVRSLLILKDDANAYYDLELLPTSGFLWVTGGCVDNPFAGKTIVSATVSTSDTAGVDTDPETLTLNAGCIINIGQLYDSTN